MKTGTVEKILKESDISISRPTLLKDVVELKLDTEKTPAGENIFRWKHISKLRFKYKYSDKKIKPFVVSVSQNKGGVGKTTSVINISKVFSYLGKTLIIDLDSQSNITRHFISESSEDDIFLFDVFDNKDLLDKSIKNISENLDIIPNNLRFERWKRKSKENKDTIFSLKSLIKKLKEKYDFIIIDTPPSLDLCLDMSLYAADYCIIPMEPEIFNLEGISNILEEIEYINSQDKNGLFNVKILGLFITQFEKNNLSEQMTEHILGNYETFKTKIRKVIAVKQAQAMKQSIFDYDETSTVALDYYNLAFEILEKING